MGIEIQSMPEELQLKFHQLIMLFPSEVKNNLQTQYGNLQRRHEVEQFRRDAQTERVLNLEI